MILITAALLPLAFSGPVVAHDNGQVFTTPDVVAVGETLTFQGVPHHVTWTNGRCNIPQNACSFRISNPQLSSTFNGKTIRFN